MSVSKWAYTPEMCDGDFCIGDCDLCNKPLLFEEKEDDMKTEWIDTRISKPEADGEYMVQKAYGDVRSMFYTVEGGWNTSYESGELKTDCKIADVSVVRWLSVPTPPEVPEAWREEWLNS